MLRGVYRKQNDAYELVDCAYTEDWDIAHKRRVAKSIGSNDVITYVAIDEKTIVGFIALKKKLIDDYMILDMMHVSAPVRGQGIGRKLFEFGKEAQGDMEARHCTFQRALPKKQSHFTELWVRNSQIIRSEKLLIKNHMICK